VNEFNDTTPLSVIMTRAELLESGTQSSVFSRSPGQFSTPPVRSLILPSKSPVEEHLEASELTGLLALDVRKIFNGCI
jgi:hypothetical protein